MKIALASCSNLPGWEIDDRPLINECQNQGLDVSTPPWDSAIDWSLFDICLLRTTWDYSHRIEEFLQWIDQVSSQTKLLNAAPIVHWNADKRYLRELAGKGVSIAPTVWLEEEENLMTIMQERGWSKAFLKPDVHMILPSKFTVLQHLCPVAAVNGLRIVL